MKTKIANSRRLDIIGNGDCSSDRETFAAMLKQWRRRLGYCSIFAAVPAILASQVAQARSDEAKKPEASVAGRTARLLDRLSNSSSNPALLRRQSKFRLPHQKVSFDPLAALGGTDDCPGRAIPGGNYTAAAPYVDSGDTTGANDTVKRLQYYYYYTLDALGPDHVYSFTLLARGPNPQIEVSTTSGTYQPLIYVLPGGFAGACPSGTGNFAYSIVAFDSHWTPGSSTATLNLNQMSYLPLNVPLHLFVDSANNDATGSGPYTIRMQDVTISPGAGCPNPNPIDCPEFLVREHYFDFFNRQADDSGLAFWTNQITSCGAETECLEVKRINVSAAFYLSIEFQETGYLVERVYKAAYGDGIGTSTNGGSHTISVPVVRFDEFVGYTQWIGYNVIVNKPGWEQLLESNKQAAITQFVRSTRFLAAFPNSMTPAQFVDKLNTNAGGPLSQSERNQLVSDLSSGAKTRAQVLRAVAEDPDLKNAEFNRAFVLMQYFGYLRRNPNDAPNSDYSGFDFWLAKLNQFHGNFIEAEMVKAFITSTEYRARFGPN